MASPSPKLFQPYRLGNMVLSNRVVLSPLTRTRANEQHELDDLAVEYYSQRASTPGTLLISEATIIAHKAGGWPRAPGIWTDKQLAAWKKITDAVHSKGSFILCQIWALGRVARVDATEVEGIEIVGPSSIPMTGRPTPRPLKVEEIKEYAQLFATAAKNAVSAGFDGVEVHAANGYLVDQFFQTVTNDRTDEYGGSVENRIRFPLEVIDAIVGAIGAEKTSLRIHPWTNYQEMGMPDPIPTFATFATRLAERHPNLAYLHVCESDTPEAKTSAGVLHSNEPIRKAWGPRTYITSNNYTRESAIEAAEKDDHTLVGFGQKFLANPDLVRRLKEDLPLNAPDYTTYYVGGARGYTDYPFATSVTSAVVTPTVDASA
ncbi:unnamed protein product [Peniophora sp. CBMAI 1063]|nr:unnamed protein product [Peniophora sp. CBMAI 1063]